MKNYLVKVIQYGEFNYITSAINQKHALMRMLTDSVDFQNIVKEQLDFKIIVKEIKNETD